MMPAYAATNGTFGPPQGQAVKRVYQAGKPVDTKVNIIPGGQGQTATIQPSQRRVYSPATSVGAPPRILPIAPKPPTPTPGVTVTPIQPGIVDLTDDDPPSASAAAPSTSATSTGGTTSKWARASADYIHTDAYIYRVVTILTMVHHLFGYYWIFIKLYLF